MSDKKKSVEPVYWIKPLFDDDGVQATSGIGIDGKEYPDPVPMAPPIGYRAEPDLMQLIRSMVQSEEVRRAQEAAGVETFEEADDFELDDDPMDELTPYERVFYPSDERGAAPGSNGDGGPQAVAAAAPSETPVKGAEGAVASPPPVKTEKEA